MYKVSIIANGFPALEVDNIPVAQGAITRLRRVLKISQQSTTVEVSAAALTLGHHDRGANHTGDRQRFTVDATERPRLYAIDQRGAGIWRIFGRRLRLVETVRAPIK